MIKSKKQMFMVIGSFILIMLLGTVTYAFFNYTRTGVANRIQVGRIYFNSEQGNSINLTNVFPIDRASVNSDTDNVGSVSIHITGDTTYTEGIEYLVTAVNVNNTVSTIGNPKTLPINIDVSYTEVENKTIGENDDDYFDHRGGNSSLYNVLTNKIISEGDKLLVGYIKPDDVGIDGTITIKAFVDKDRIAISDTYPSSSLEYWYNTDASEEDIDACITYMTNNYSESLKSNETMDAFCRGTGKLDYSTMESWANYYFTEEDNMFLEEHHLISKYQNGTTSEWVNERNVFTTKEWNTLQENGISFQIKVEASEGIWIPEPSNAMNTLPNTITSEKNLIKEVYFSKMNENNMDQRYNSAQIKADITYNNEGRVLAWLEQIENEEYYKLYIVSNTTTYLTTGNSLFQNFLVLDKIEFNNVDTSRVTDMKYMFYGDTSLTSIDLSGLGSDNLERIGSLFEGCNNLKTINMSRFNFGVVDFSQNYYGTFSYLENLETVNLTNANTSGVTSMYAMFQGSQKLKNIILTGIDTSNVTDMSYMFRSCKSLESMDLSIIDTSNVTTMYLMFDGDIALKSVIITDTSSIINMGLMFYECTSLTSIDLSGLGSDNLDYISNMFIYCNNLKTINMSNFNFGKADFTKNSNYNIFNNLTGLESIDLSNANFSNFTSLYQMFYGCTSLLSVDLSSIDTSKIQNMGGMFSGCTSLESVNLSGLGSNDLQNINNIFYHCTNLTTINMSGFNMGKITNLSDLSSPFNGLLSLKTLDLSNANFSNVQNMHYTFGYTNNLETINMNNINISNVTNMSHMFQNCNKLTSFSLKNIDISKITTMQRMFSGCSSLTSVDLSGTGSSILNNVEDMFYQCTNLKTINMSGFNLGKNSYRLFSHVDGLETVDLTNANTSQLTNTDSMFYYSEALTTIYVSSDWNLNNVTNSSNMFYGSTSLVGGQGTTYDSSHIDKEYAIIDDKNNGNPGYLTLKTS